MSNLKIRLDVYNLNNAPKEFGVVTNIYSLPSKERTMEISKEKRRELQNILIPSGPPWESPLEYQTVALPAGRYYVEAILPSNEVVGDEVQITDDTAPKKLRLKADHSPREWLSWQTFSGNVPTAQNYQKRLNLTPASKSVQLETILVSTGSPSENEPLDFENHPDIAGLHQGYFFANHQLQEDLKDGLLTTFPGWGKVYPPARLSSPLVAFTSDEVYDFFEFDMNKIINEIGAPVYGDHYRQEQFDRYYLLTHGDDFPNQYSVLPIPWVLTDFSGEQATVESLILRTGAKANDLDGFDQGFRMSVVLQEKIFGTLIGYLGTGSLSAADTIVSRARDLLFEKLSNPMAAAAGAYVLVNNLKSERPTYWHEWIKNLMNWFPWLPDGAILYGRVLLSLGRDPNTLAEARDCFLEGFRRGLPFYSKGVGYLLDGLNRFAYDARKTSNVDEPVEAAIKIVKDLSLRINVRQPFTCVQMD